MNFKNQKAIYVQIADHIIDSILGANLKGGDRLQSVREMAATVQVNPNTVVRTYGYLQDEGIIFNKRGIGYFVAEDAQQKTQALRRTAFIENVLPELFSQMKLLGIDFEELQKIYKKMNNGTEK